MIGEIVIRGGDNVYPREIEEVLYEHPAVREAAAIVLRAGAAVTPEQMRDYIKDRVAAYKYPRLVRFVDALRNGPTGKIIEREIHFAVRELKITPAMAAAAGA
ncbi:AMP-binding enzyme [Mycolicibacterium austroafricanum]|uniref:AMP-binding enzyme n=1 Tax=Mycolicibacterium austroafricanum TaxID=39687 RepID=UPI001CA33B34|nr:hypothetical protein [Mycolicibacterium austroafricanum]QZT58597.1 hypothetical protein JN084_08450 [Mycolicibacterium austroafricanum]